nr:HD domain-containing phosphohydrolase [uncultured Agathobaculum sp.]
MLALPGGELFEILTRSLNRVNDLLVGHGERVAYGVMALLDQDGRFSQQDICQIIWTVLFHDIGSFRRTDTWSLELMENDPRDTHALYGFVFLKTFFPFSHYTPIVRYHHASESVVEQAPFCGQIKQAVKYLRCVDATDLHRVKFPKCTKQEILAFYRQQLEMFGLHAMPNAVLQAAVPDNTETCHEYVKARLMQMPLSDLECQALLRTLVCAMDFRSHYTALHCTIMVHASDMLAEYCGLDQHDRYNVHIGAILHDLGKIAIPVLILEAPGKLDGRLWEIMKSHVMLTEDILKGYVSDEILQIAVRHHERLDGSGYPRGLGADDLTLPQRIVAVGDIVSALSEQRSYKPSFPLEEVMQILRDMGQAGKLCPYVLGVLEKNQQKIYQSILQEGLHTAGAFEQVYEEYYRLLDLGQTGS